jgi:glycosyltransferase involved in cell wall biosynthesis
LTSFSHHAAGLPVTVVLPVLNEQLNVTAALESIQWAAEIFVVDSGSTDDTAAIGEAHGATVIQFNYESGGPKKKGMVAPEPAVFVRVGALPRWR